MPADPSWRLPTPFRGPSDRGRRELRAFPSVFATTEGGDSSCCLPDAGQESRWLRVWGEHSDPQTTSVE